ncbi:MAG TPA: hypothetical protein VHL34_24870 [Rhizomicrobium sp.]|jgi:hypothetical protein|nr:hypothetical protein [Rhizomicrobium sp.]
MTGEHNPDRFRNILAFFLVGAFVAVLPCLILKDIPAGNRDIITYMVGQLSGMATTALGFYFVNKVGADALEAKKADNTSKALDAIAAAQGGPVKPDVTLKPGETAQAAPDPIGEQ